MELLRTDPYNEDAWIWLTHALPSDDLRISAMEVCLKYNPESEKARQRLNYLTSLSEQLGKISPLGEVGDFPPAAQRPIEGEPVRGGTQEASHSLLPIPRVELDEAARVDLLRESLADEGDDFALLREGLFDEEPSQALASASSLPQEGTEQEDEIPPMLAEMGSDREVGRIDLSEAISAVEAREETPAEPSPESEVGSPSLLAGLAWEGGQIDLSEAILALEAQEETHAEPSPESEIGSPSLLAGLAWEGGPDLPALRERISGGDTAPGEAQASPQVPALDGAAQEIAVEPSILAVLGQAEPKGETGGYDLRQEILQERTVEPEVSSSLPANSEEVGQQAGGRKGSRRGGGKLRTSLRAILVIFYALVLLGAGWSIYQGGPAGVLAWFHNLPRMARSLVSPEPTPTHAPDLAANATAAALRSGSGVLLFTSRRSGRSGLYLERMDGSEPVQLLEAGSADVLISDLAWAPDGSQFVFVRGSGEKTDLFTALADGSGVVAQTNDQAGNAHPSWSPQGDQLVFTSRRDGGQDLYLLDLATARLKRLTENAGNNSAPAWAPDGSQIAFTSDRDGFLGLYLMNPDGSQVIRLTSKNRSVSSPAWSPDSSQLIYTSTNQNDRLLYLSSRDGKVSNRVTFGPARDDHAAWSADGKWIIFDSERKEPGKPTLYLMRPNGEEMHLFDPQAGWAEYPAWFAGGK